MNEKTKDKAKEIWQGMNKSERQGVRFGMFPADKMQAAQAEGYDTHDLAVALMTCAEKQGGMLV